MQVIHKPLIIVIKKVDKCSLIMCIQIGKMNIFEYDTDIKLWNGEYAGAIQQNSLKNPPIIIANYLFDTITPDYFQYRDGKQCIIIF